MSAFERLLASIQLEGPTGQHYISESYLKRFTEVRRLVVYDRQGNTFSRPQRPKFTAVIPHLYTFLDNEDRQRFEFEKMFGIVESRAGSALKAVVNNSPLIHEDREYLALFMAMTAIRTPAAFAEARIVREKAEIARLKLIFSSEADAYRLIKNFEPAGTPEAEIRRLAKAAFEMVDQEGFKVTVPEELARQSSLKNWATVAKALYQRDWTVVHSPSAEDEYITSDSPVVFSPLEGTEDLPLGYESLHTHILFPLSRHAALVMNGDEGRIRHTTVKPEQVARFNSSVAADCFRYVIGSQENVILRTVAAPRRLAIRN
ncbi:MAG: DUF4238 domain-containing protein, partial [Ideonella sp.]|nr:DUF4238 domain-containing protein [Ideonella sp.]